MQQHEHRYAALDGIRGIAALIVMSLHLQFFFPWAHFAHGYLAVDLFFIMSGFVLARIYEAKLVSKRMTTMQFMRFRFIRLYPLYILGAIFGTASIAATGMFESWPLGMSWTKLAMVTVPALLMLPMPKGFFLYPLNTPCWSLFFELLANLLYARFILGLSDRVLATIIAAAWIPIVWLTMHGSLDGGWAVQSAGAGLARVIFSFSIGVLISRHTSGTRKISNVATLLIMAVVVCTMAINIGDRFDHFYSLATVTIIFPAMVIVATRIEPNGLIRQICTFSGAISYGIYVLHRPIGNLVATIERASLGLGAHAIALTGFAFLIALTTFVYWLDKNYDPALRSVLGRMLSVRAGDPGIVCRNVTGQRET